jgi:hypothetical protein
MIFLVKEGAETALRAKCRTKVQTADEEEKLKETAAKRRRSAAFRGTVWKLKCE